MDSLNLNDRVCVIGKNICGRIAYIGETHIAKGEWFGIVLDEPKGRNNGCVDGKRYFKCPRDYGMFARACQLEKEGEKCREKTAYPNYLAVSTNSRTQYLGEEVSVLESVSQTKSSNVVSGIHSAGFGIRMCRVQNGVNPDRSEAEREHSECFDESSRLQHLADSDRQGCGVFPSTKTNTKQLPTRLKDNTSGSSEISLKTTSSAVTNASGKSDGNEPKTLNVASESNLKRLSDELKYSKHKRDENEKELKSAKSKNKQLTVELEKLGKGENKLRKQLVNAEKQILKFKKEARKAKRDIEMSEACRTKMETEMQDMRSITEHVIVEKEIAEEKSEHLEFLLAEECDKCKNIEIEIKILREEMEIQCIDGVPAFHVLKKMKNENQLLRSALHRIKELYNELQYDIATTRKESDEKSYNILKLKQAGEALENTISYRELEIAELCGTVDDVMFVDDLVFQVTDRNLSYESQLRKLHLELNNVEELLEVSENIAYTLEDLKQICLEDIDILKLKLMQSEAKHEKQKLTIRDRELEIEKYHDLTRKLLYEKSQLSWELHKVQTQRNEAVTEAESLKLMNHREYRKTIKELLQIENLKIHLDSSKEKLKCWSYFLPREIFEEDGTNVAIDAKVMTSLATRKLNTFVEHLKLKLFELCEKPDPKMFRTLITSSEMLEFALKIKCVVQHISNRFYEMHLNELFSLDKHHNHMLQINLKVDGYLTMLCDNEVDKKENLEKIQNDYVETLRNFNLAATDVFQKAELEYYMITSHIKSKILSNCCEFITFTNVTDVTRNNINQIFNDVKVFERTISKILYHWKTSYKELGYINPNVSNLLKTSFECLQEMVNLVTPILHDTTDSGERDISVHAERLGFLTKLMPKLQKCQSELDSSLKNDCMFIEHDRNISKSSVIETWAREVKLKDKQVISRLRNKIISLELEMSKQSKELVREKATASKCRRLDAVIARLKKNNQTTKTQNKATSTADDNVSHVLANTNQTSETTLCSGDCALTQKYASIKLQDQELVLRYLSRKVWELKRSRVQVQLSCLEPLKVLPTLKYNSDSEGIIRLQKRLRELLERLTPLLVSQVVDISGENDDKGKKYERYLLNRTLAKREIQEEIRKVQCDLHRLKNPKHVFGLV